MLNYLVKSKPVKPEVSCTWKFPLMMGVLWFNACLRHPHHLGRCCCKQKPVTCKLIIGRATCLLSSTFEQEYWYQISKFFSRLILHSHFYFHSLVFKGQPIFWRLMDSNTDNHIRRETYYSIDNLQHWRCTVFSPWYKLSLIYKNLFR